MHVLLMHVPSVFMMSWNVSWVVSPLVGVIDVFCRVSISYWESRLVASWNLMRSVCMFYDRIG
jgi:hypothetical protein